MVLRRIGVWSAAKFNAVIYAIIGLLIGIVISLVSMVAGASASDAGFGAFPAMFVGVGAVVIFPLMYGCLGLIGGAIGAAIYNLVAGMMGGIEVDFEPKPGVPAMR